MCPNTSIRDYGGGEDGGEGGGCCANFNVLASARIYCSIDLW